MRRYVLAGLIAATVLFGLMETPASSSQQPAPVEYLWAVVPNGVFADARMQDALGDLGPNNVTLTNGTLRYVGFSPNVRRVTSGIDDARLLMAASGFSSPGSDLRELHRCRIFVISDPSGFINDVLSKTLSFNVAMLGIKMQACDAATSLDNADFVIWPASQSSPLVQYQLHPEKPSFLALSDTSRIPPTDFLPPSTGDGGLIGQPLGRY